MKIVITGGGGFIGFKLAKALLARGTLAGADGTAQKITRVTLVDQAFPADLPEDPRLETLAGDISDPGFAARAIAPHLLLPAWGQAALSMSGQFNEKGRDDGAHDRDT